MCEHFKTIDRCNDTLAVRDPTDSDKVGSELYVYTNNLSGVWLSVDDVKRLRKALKKWLIDNGHKAAKVAV